MIADDEYSHIQEQVEGIKALLRGSDMPTQGATIGHVLGWWLSHYSDASGREQSVKLAADLAMSIATFYREAAKDGVEIDEPLPHIVRGTG